MKIIRLTEKQLREAYNDDFSYISDDPTRQYDGNTYVYTAGKIDDKEHGEPNDTDKLSVMTPQGYWAGWHRRNTSIRENVHGDADAGEEYTNPQIVDMDSNIEQTDVYQDKDPTNVNTVIPQSVTYHMNLFLNAIKTLDARKQSMIVKELMKRMNLKTDPSWVAAERRTATQQEQQKNKL